MWRTNLKIVLTVIGTLVVYTAVANMIPQVRSEVPEAVAIGADATPEQLVSIGDELYHGAGGCEACHGLGTRAPDLVGVIGTRCAERQPEMSCKEYLHASLVEPGAYVVEGFQPIMPDMSRTLSGAQIWALVAYLQSQGGEVTVTADDLPAEGEGTAGGVGAAGAGVTAGGVGAAGAGGADATDPRALFQSLGCTACHVLDGVGGPVGPPFEEMAGKDPSYIRRSILEPAADTAPGYEAVAGTMPPNFGDRLTATQLEAIVDFLAGGAAGGAEEDGS